MDEDVKKAIDGVSAQIQVLAALYADLSKRLDAVQDLAVAISALTRATEKALTDHLTALAAATDTAPATRPRPGPEVG